jgi:hypothetical protein
MEKVGSYRWRICALLLFATTINYVDRQMFGVLAPDLQHRLGWNELEYGYIVTAGATLHGVCLTLALIWTGRIATIGHICARRHAKDHVERRKRWRRAAISVCTFAIASVSVACRSESITRVR